MPPDRTSAPNCPCCDGDTCARTFTGVERQLPSPEPTAQEYAVCARCGAWFATGGAFDASRHYPSAYYSFSIEPDSTITRFLRGARARHETLGRSLVGALVARTLGVPEGLAAFARLRAPRTARILDVGAGGGRLVRDLYAAGFHGVVGCDAFGDDDPGPPPVRRGGLQAVTGTWDVIMYHHCLEHIDDPLDELRMASRRLAPGGSLLVRVPLADSLAAVEYGDRWVQLDAPRHRVVPTAAGMHALAARAGLRVVSEWRDSSAFQFWGSELYRLDVPLRAESALPSSRFDARILREWAARSTRLNADGRGDQGAFVLQQSDAIRD